MHHRLKKQITYSCSTAAAVNNVLSHAPRMPAYGFSTGRMYLAQIDGDMHIPG